MQTPNLCTWVLAVTCVLCTASSASETNTPRAKYVALGQGKYWVAFDIVTRKAERLPLPSTITPTDLAISDNGKTVVFTADTSNNREARLFVWDRNPEHPPRQIGEPRGYYADPTISKDGKWVYFAHNTAGRGTPLAHMDRAFAQMYRIQLDGSGLEALTTERGCHFAPTLRVQESLVYVHANCGGPDRSIEVLDLRARQTKRLVTSTKTMDELELSPDGKRALFSATGNDSLSLQEVELKTGQTRKLVEFIRDSKRARPRYGSKPGEFFYVRQNAVWLLAAGKEQRLLSLREVAP